MSKSELDERVRKFLAGRSGGQSIDDLSMTPAQRDLQKADFFLEDRRIVCEVKSLQTDTAHKIEKIVRPRLDSQQALVYGTWPVESVLKFLPDAEEVRKEIYSEVTSAVDEGFEKANRQIRETKRAFGCPFAEGVLVVVNDLVDVLSPLVLARRIHELMHKRTREKSLRFPEVDAVWIVSETHYIKTADGGRGAPHFNVVRGKCAAQGAVRLLIDEWGAFNGRPNYKIPLDLVPTLDIRENEKPSGGTIRRSEMWIREYRGAPYLRHHTLPELTEYAVKLIALMAQASIKSLRGDGPVFTADKARRFGDLLEEVKERALDMRTFNEAAKTRIEALRKDPARRVTLQEVEAAALVPPIVVSGGWYTNRHGQSLRCFATTSDKAGLLLMDTLPTGPLNTVIRLERSAWSEIWPILDERKVSAFEERFQRFAASNPSAVIL